MCSKLKPCVLEQTGRNRQHSLEEGGSFAGANAHLDKTRKSKGCKTTERQTNYCSIKTNTKGFQDSCRRDRGIVVFFNIYFKTTQFYHKTLWFTQSESVMCTNLRVIAFIFRSRHAVCGAQTVQTATKAEEGSLLVGSRQTMTNSWFKLFTLLLFKHVIGLFPPSLLSTDGEWKREGGREREGRRNLKRGGGRVARGEMLALVLSQTLEILL